ncbi:MAG: SMP-30/gluconolactonase/LRE family protein [Verrucomicrobia bacterium]|nr:SMP-30/gluconolactonase/LRE family protein [Verrucomicrobiota bacterium]
MTLEASRSTAGSNPRAATLLALALTLLAGRVATAAEPSNNLIVAKGAKLELLHTRQVKLNSGLTEGPALAPDGSVYFTDMPFGKDNGMILRFDPKTRKTTVFTDNSGKSNGLAFDEKGNLLSCDGADGGSRAIRRWNLKTGQSEILADRYQGKRLNSPNDLCVDSRGRVYFTDPRYSGAEPRELPNEAVYRAEKNGEVIEITREVEKPNGLALSPDERTLYLIDHNNGGNRLSPSDPEPKRGAMKIYAFPLNDQGRVSGPRKTLVDFGKESGGDGMRVDAKGNIYVAVRSLARPGLLVINPAGAEQAFIPTGPTNQSGLFEEWRGIPSNMEFGTGADRHTLYVTMDKSLYRIRVKTQGLPPRWAGR